MAAPAWRDAILRALGEARRPLTEREIAEWIVSRGLASRGSRPPKIVVSETLTHSLRTEGSESPFVREPGRRFRLRRTDEKGGNRLPRIVTSFGFCWVRAAVDWNATPRLVGTGRKRNSAQRGQVDFAGQGGAYLLHGDEDRPWTAAYRGVAGAGDLGRRLAMHTRDERRGTWNRFSWFGLRPLGAKGAFGPMPAARAVEAAMESIITIAEGILRRRQEAGAMDAVSDSGDEREYRQVLSFAGSKNLLLDAARRAVAESLLFRGSGAGTSSEDTGTP